jgi:hypothetical protein
MSRIDTTPYWMDSSSLSRFPQLQRDDRGFDATFIDTVPFVGRPGIRFDSQAHFHPRKYLAGLAKAFEAADGQIITDAILGRKNPGPISSIPGGRQSAADSGTT